MIVRDSYIGNNSGVGDGGGIANSGLVDIYDGIVDSNFSESDGGGISNHGTLRLHGTTTIGSSEQGNSTFGTGGGIYAGHSSYTVVCATCTVTGNTAGGWWGDIAFPGGGVFVEGDGTLELEEPNRVFGNTPDQIAP